MNHLMTIFKYGGLAAVVAFGSSIFMNHPVREFRMGAMIGFAIASLLVLLASVSIIVVGYKIAGATFRVGVAGTSVGFKSVAIVGRGSMKAGSAGWSITRFVSRPFLRWYMYRQTAAFAVASVVLVLGAWPIVATGGMTYAPWLIVPLAVAAAIMTMPDAIERMKATRWYVRQFAAGGVEFNDFASKRATKRNRRQSLRRFLPSVGMYAALSKPLYMGHTFPENTGSRQAYFLDTDVSRVTFACTGSGKAISDAIHLAPYDGSMIVATTKPDLFEFMAPFRCDAAKWHDQHHEKNPGVDCRSVGRVQKHCRGGRVMLLDPSGQSKTARSGKGSRYSILCDIDIKSPKAASFILDVATGCVPINEKASDPVWQNTTRGILASGIGHIMTTERDPSKHTMPHVADFLLGMDDQGRCDPDLVIQRIAAMSANPALGGLIASGATALAQMGERQFGSVMTELRNALRWTQLPEMREHLSGYDFKFSEVGADDHNPLSVFIVAPTLAPAESAGYMRTVAAMSLAVFRNRPRPKSNVLWVGDEYRQWGKGIDAIAAGSMVLRDKGVKLLLYLQNYAALVYTVGETNADSICSSSTEVYYGANDDDTAERVSKKMGYRGEHLVVSPQAVLRELRANSNIKYVFPYEGMPVRLERRSFKKIKTKEGLVLKALKSLAGIING